MKNEAGLAKIHQANPPILQSREGGRGDIIAAIAQLCAGGRGAEVGTFNGTFADQILEQGGVGELICVDPYRAYDDFKDAINEMDLDAIYAQAQRFLSRFGDRVRFIREFSEEAAAQVEDGSLDYVYIDGNHQSLFVQKDMNAWWPKLKPGGLLLGDDVADMTDEGRNEDGDLVLVHTRKADGTPDLYGQYGVYHALRKFAAEQDVGYIITGHQFLMPKPD